MDRGKRKSHRCRSSRIASKTAKVGNFNSFHCLGWEVMENRLTVPNRDLLTSTVNSQEVTSVLDDEVSEGLPRGGISHVDDHDNVQNANKPGTMQEGSSGVTQVHQGMSSDSTISNPKSSHNFEVGPEEWAAKKTELSQKFLHAKE